MGKSRHCLTVQTVCNTLADTARCGGQDTFRHCSFHASGGRGKEEEEAKILVDTLADTVAELEVETLENTPGDVETKAVVGISRITRSHLQGERLEETVGNL